MALMLGTYALAWGRSEAEHAEVVSAASEDRSVDGLEVPWTGSLGIADLAEVLTATRPDWRIVVTSLPGTMARVAESADVRAGVPRSRRQAGGDDGCREPAVCGRVAQ